MSSELNFIQRQRLKKLLRTLHSEAVAYLDFLSVGTDSEMAEILSAALGTRLYLDITPVEGLPFPHDLVDGVVPHGSLINSPYIRYHNALGRIQQATAHSMDTDAIMLRSGATVWKMSLRGFTYPELFASARRIWAELRRGEADLGTDPDLRGFLNGARDPDDLLRTLYPAALCPWVRGVASAVQPFFLPESVTVPVESLMDAALLLVCYGDSPDEELRRRQRSAACAFGATDWLCQARKLSMTDLQWITASSALVMRYLLRGDANRVAHRLGAERVGRAAAEVGSGCAALASCASVGANAMKKLLVEHDEKAPLDITECIMEWGGDGSVVPAFRRPG